MKTCQDCKREYSELSNHTGKDKWCEDCFDKGLHKDESDHFDKYFEGEFKELEMK